jgi:hypothetical protein
VSIEACDGNVTEGKMVCAANEYAPRPANPWMFGEAVCCNASGRSPSMEMMTTRLDAGVGEGVTDGDAMGVAVGVLSGGRVAFTVRVAEAMGGTVGATVCSAGSATDPVAQAYSQLSAASHTTSRGVITSAA